MALELSATPHQLSFDDELMIHIFGLRYRLLMIGAGVLVEYQATMALVNGFRLAVCDPRPKYGRTWTVSGVERLTGMPDDVLRDFAVDLRICTVALSHDPKLGDLALLEALQSLAFYIGAADSRRNSQVRRERLIEHFDETEHSSEHLNEPKGIYITAGPPRKLR